MPKSSIPLYPTASGHDVASHVHIQRVSAAGAREEVLQAAKRVAEGSETPEIGPLRLRLEKAIGVPITELAEDAASSLT